MGALANTTPPPDFGSYQYEAGPSLAYEVIPGRFEEWLQELWGCFKGWLQYATFPFGQFPDQNPFTDLEYEDPSYPDGGPYKGESLGAYHRRKWDELDPSIKRAAVAHLRSIIPVNLAEEARGQMEEDPEEWMILHHHTAGPWVRNELRSVVFDDQLPTECWDDYYVMAFEEAIGGTEMVAPLPAVN